jgi:hypothetical protein
MKRSVGERARVRISRIFLGIGTRAADSGVVAGWWRNAPTPIAVHRRGGGAAKKSDQFTARTHPFTIDNIYKYTYISEITLSPTTHKAAKSPLQRFFGVRQDIYVTFII